MANWSTPSLSSTYSDVLSFLKTRDVDAITQLASLTGVSELPPGAIRFDVTNKKWLRWGAGVWTDLDISGAALPAIGGTLSGNLSFSGTGRRITADFSNATVANRTAFQTSTVNAVTSLSCIPNGTGTAAGMNLFNSSDPNNSSYVGISCDASNAAITSSATGTGVVKNLLLMSTGNTSVALNTNGSNRLVCDGAGTVTAYTSTFAVQRNGVNRLWVDGSDNITIDSGSAAGIYGRVGGVNRMYADPTNTVLAAPASGGVVLQQNGATRLFVDNNGITNVTASSVVYPSLRVYSHASSNTQIDLMGSSANRSGIKWVNSNYTQVYGELGFNPAISGAYITTNFLPGNDNAYVCGYSGYRWSSVWAVTGTIQTSDERQKTDIEDIDPAKAVEFVKAARKVSYRWLVGSNEEVREVVDGVEQVTGYRPKPGKRLHTGFLAQDVNKLLTDLGIKSGAWIKTDPNDPESEEGLRYEQLLPIFAAALQATIERLDALEAAK